jgi:hypothetical protein
MDVLIYRASSLISLIDDDDGDELIHTRTLRLPRQNSVSFKNRGTVEHPFHLSSLLCALQSI